MSGKAYLESAKNWQSPLPYKSEETSLIILFSWDYFLPKEFDRIA